MIEQFIDKIRYKIGYFCDIKTILEIGSRDAIQAVEFADTFKSAKIYAFEANPESVKNCFYTSRNYVNIEVIPKAVTDRDGEVDFYPIDMFNSPIKNIGASSLYPISELYRSKENLLQKKITVPCCRLDTFCKEKGVSPDLIWCDLEGGELPALQSLGIYLKNVKAIYVETTFQRLYVGNTMFDELNDFLVNNDFSLFYKPDELYRGDCIYLNNNN